MESSAATTPASGDPEQEMDMSDADLRTSNMAIVRRYIDAINRWDFDTKRTLLAENAVFEMPYAPAGFERRITGRDKIIAFVQTVPSLIDAENLHHVRLETFSSDPGEIVAEYKSDMVIKPTGAEYRNDYVSRFTVRDGKITRFAEYYDPIRLVVALGGSVTGGNIDTAALPQLT
jgi:ketosteroid isomerase-like protein